MGSCRIYPTNNYRKWVRFKNWFWDSGWLYLVIPTAFLAVFLVLAGGFYANQHQADTPSRGKSKGGVVLRCTQEG